jgi:DNA-binding XRE family transcriptional regulator
MSTYYLYFYMIKLGEVDPIHTSSAWISLQLKISRVVLGLSQADLADLAGVSPQTIKKLELPGANPKYETVTKIINVFRIFGLEYVKSPGEVRVQLDEALEQVIADNRVKEYIRAKIEREQ